MKHPVVVWNMPPRVSGVGIITAGVAAFCRANGFLDRDSRRIQVCVEGVFAYCVNTIRSGGDKNEIVVKLGWKEREIIVVIEHCGPGGEWDSALHLDSPIKRKSFDAMGLFIAREMLDSLTHKAYFDMVTSVSQHIYTLTYRLEWNE